MSNQTQTMVAACERLRPEVLPTSESKPTRTIIDTHRHIFGPKLKQKFVENIGLPGAPCLALEPRVRRILNLQSCYPSTMQVPLAIPDTLADQLLATGEDPARAALKALAIEGYRSRH